jgi:hypothetical protein
VPRLIEFGVAVVGRTGGVGLIRIPDGNDAVEVEE